MSLFVKRPLALFLTVAVLSVSGSLSAGAGTLPASFRAPAASLAHVEMILMPPVDTERAREEDERMRPFGGPRRFALPAAVNFSPLTSGTWEEREDGTLLWRLRIRSVGAKSLNLGFERFHMPEGGELHVYDPEGTTLRGPFTARDNEEHGQLWTPLVRGDEAVIEVSVPAGLDGELELELTAVNHAYKDLADPFEKSGSCNIDVACPEGDPWSDEIRSVALYSIDGFLICTGTLLNNTSQDLTPYFLTARHCGVTSSNDATVVVYWNYETSLCGGARDGQLDDYQTGSILRASSSPSDFTLLELDDMPSDSFNVHWAGWDRSGDGISNVATIHHPSADEKSISFDFHTPKVTSYGGTIVPGDGTHLRVFAWDLGTTESGSSGGPLFDAQHRVVGQLHGGLAACGNNESDWFGRFFVSWNGEGTSSTRLRSWLDKANTGHVRLDGIDKSDLVNPLWPTAVDLGNGWKNTWLGVLNDNSFPWVYHTSLGWLNAAGTEPSDVWLYSSVLDWLWTGEGLYPYLYSTSTQGWYWHQASSANPAWLYNFISESWEAYYLTP